MGHCMGKVLHDGPCWRLVLEDSSTLANSSRAGWAVLAKGGQVT